MSNEEIINEKENSLFSMFFLLIFVLCVLILIVQLFWGLICLCAGAFDLGNIIWIIIPLIGIFVSAIVVS